MLCGLKRILIRPTRIHESNRPEHLLMAGVPLEKAGIGQPVQ